MLGQQVYKGVWGRVLGQQVYKGGMGACAWPAGIYGGYGGVCLASRYIRGHERDISQDNPFIILNIVSIL